MTSNTPLARFRRNVIEAWAVHVGIAAGLFESLEHPGTLVQLAEREGWNAEALRALLAALMACGYVSETADSFGLTETSRRHCLRESADFIGDALSFLRTTRLYEQYPRILREGGGVGLDSEQWTYVTRGSAMYAPSAIAALLATWPSLRERAPLRVLDVGCGQGTYLIELARRLPNLVAIGIDPTLSVVDDARNNVAKAGFEAVVRIVHGSVTDLSETFDFVMINQVAHVVGDKVTRELLAQVKPRAISGALVVLQEIVAGGSSDPSPELFGFNMKLLFDHGRVFDVHELSNMFSDVGFRDVTSCDIEGATQGLVWIAGRA
jgi:SAM-dependent methyltransferase